MVRSLAGALVPSGAVGYDRTGRVVDYGTVGEFTIADRSGNVLNAALMTAIYAISDGVADKLLNADCSGLGAGTYYLTGKINPESTTAKQTLDGGSTASNLSGLTVGIWQSFQTPDFTGTPSGVTLGWDGTDFGAAGYSEVSIHDASTGEVLAPWQLNDSPASDLDGVLAADQFGNYNGSHIGGAAGTGEGNILQALPTVVKTSPWFSGSDSVVELGSNIELSGDFLISGNFLLTDKVVGTSLILGNEDADSGRFAVAAAQFPLIEINNVVYSFGAITVEWGTYYSYTLERVGSDVTLELSGISPETVSANSDTFNINRIGNNDAINYAVGLIHNTNINDQAAYLGYGDTPWADTIGSNDGTASGTFSTLAAQSATILQMGRLDFNVYPVFNGADTYVSVPAGAAVDYFGACEIKFDVYIEDTSEPGVIASLGLASYRILINGGNWLVNTTNTGVAVEPGLSSVKVAFSIAGNAVSLNVNGSDVWEGDAVGASPSSSFYIGSSFTGSPFAIFRGIIKNLSLTGSAVKNFTYQGYGLTPWKDISGEGNDGTPIGTFADQYVPESTTAGTDVFGNPIQFKRPNSSVVNLTAEDSHVETPDSALLDTIKTVSGWFYYDGTDAIFLDWGTPTLKTNLGKIEANGFTTPAYYIDGVNTDTIGAVGWHHYMVTSTEVLDAVGIDAYALSQGNMVCYADTKTSDTALQNFNATKGKYL